MNQPICPHCHEELIDAGEGDFTTSYFCCTCKIMVAIYDMTDLTPCEENEEDE
jgi:hypothetical protein